MPSKTETRVAEILAMRGVDARNTIRKENDAAVVELFIEQEEAGRNRTIVLTPARSRLKKLRAAEEAKPKTKKAAPAKKAKATKAKAEKKAARKPLEVPADAPKGDKTCPCCDETKDIEKDFGYRRMKTKLKSGEEKIRFAVQSHCRSCRSEAAKKKAAEKKQAAKAA